MFCPLCQAEYADGITSCGACRIDLVSSLTEARNSSIRLWRGDRQRTLDKILAALDAAGISSHFEEIVNNSSRSRLLGVPIRRMKPTFEYEVWILSSDSERARAAIAGLKTTRAPSLWDELNWETIAKGVWKTLRGLSQPRNPN
jgi:hypothetical protein